MKRNFLIIFVGIILVFIVINPELNINSFFLGIQVWATVILPALFPFLFFTKILGELGLPEKIGKQLSPITQKLFHTDGISGYIYTMSVLSGYPVGAKLTSDCYELKLIDKGQACRITSYTSTSGPLFIVGTVGVGMFLNQTVGLFILISHFIGALLNGILYRNYKYNKPNKEKDNTIEKLQYIKSGQHRNLLEDSMLNSIKSITIIGGYVAIFFMLISIVNNYNLFFPITFIVEKIFPSINMEIFSSILNGIIEVTRGCLDISKASTNLKSLTIIGTAIISFGGCSVHFQAYTFLKKIGIGAKVYILQKTTHSLFSTILAIILSFLFL